MLPPADLNHHREVDGVPMKEDIAICAANSAVYKQAADRLRRLQGFVRGLSIPVDMPD